VSDFQIKVKERFAELYATLQNVDPKIIDVTGKSREDLGSEIEQLVVARMEAPERPSLDQTLW
jgi:hypothetical protein